jgi:hypothetical protein
MSQHNKLKDFSFEAPIPGQSLTEDKENPRPHEKPSQFNTVEDAAQDIFISLTEEGKYEKIVDAMRQGVPIEAISQIVLFQGFTQGKWSTDLKILLIEPTIYILMWLAAQADIEPVLEIGGDNWDEEDDIRNKVRRDINSLEQSTGPQQMSNLEGELPPSLLSSMSNFKENV